MGGILILYCVFTLIFIIVVVVDLLEKKYRDFALSKKTIPKIYFTNEQIAQMKQLLLDPKLINDRTRKELLCRCFSKIVRYATNSNNSVIIAYNFGRAQELLGSIGGKKQWWDIIEPLFYEKKYNEIILFIQQYAKLLNLQLED